MIILINFKYVESSIVKVHLTKKCEMVFYSKIKKWQIKNEQNLDKRSEIIIFISLSISVFFNVKGLSISLNLAHEDNNNTQFLIKKLNLHSSKTLNKYKNLRNIFDILKKYYMINNFKTLMKQLII